MITTESVNNYLSEKDLPYWWVIDDARRSRNMSWEVLANESGLRRNTITIARIEGRVMNIEETISMCNVLCIRPGDLFFRYPARVAIQQVHFEYSEGDSIAKRFWQFTDHVRKEQRLSWASIAQQIGISRSTLSTAKSYDRPLSFDKACMILVVLQVSVDDAFDIICNEENQDKSLEGRFSRLNPESQRLVSNLIDALLKEQMKA